MLCSCVSATACCVHVYQLQRVVFMCISYSVLCSCVSATACCVHVYQLQRVVFMCISYSVLCSYVSATACCVHVYQLQPVVFMCISYSVLCSCVSATACCVYAYQLQRVVFMRGCVVYRISISREEYLTEEDQQQQDMLDIRCLQVLRALIHNQIKMIDPEEEDSNPVHYRG